MSFNDRTYSIFLKIINNVTEEVIDFFERDQDSINMQLNKFEWTPLQAAAYKGNQKLVEYFLRNGAQKDIKNKSGYSAEMLAENNGFEEIRKFIHEFEENQRNGQMESCSSN